ncbi:MAG: DNA recombination protein RmuC [Dehalococcoidia bacterium]
MEALNAVLLIALLGMAGLALVLGIALLQRKPSEEPEAGRMEQQLAMLRNELTQALAGTQQTVLGQMNAADQKLNQRLEAVDNRIGQSLSNQSETMGRIDQQLGAVGQSAQRILELRDDVSSLRDVLQPPKLRGGFGELLLEQLVKQVLTDDHYSTQYRFRDNTVVDMVIRTPDGLVPIDSKFPIESFRRLLEADGDDAHTRARRHFIREVKARIDEVAKYIKPDDGTLDFALMYVPAENVFYETLTGSEDESAMTYALERGVHLCSPNTFHAFLQVVLRGFRGLKVQEEAKEIMERLAYFKREFAKFRHEFDVLGGHLGHAKNKYDDLDKLSGRLTDKLEIDMPVQQTLPEPEQVAARSTLPRPSLFNGHDEDE